MTIAIISATLAPAGVGRTGVPLPQIAASARHGSAAYQLPRQRPTTPAAMFIAQATYTPQMLRDVGSGPLRQRRA